MREAQFLTAFVLFQKNYNISETKVTCLAFNTSFGGDKQYNSIGICMFFCFFVFFVFLQV